MAAWQRYVALSHPKYLGQKSHRLRIGLPIVGRGGEARQLAAGEAGQRLGTAGVGLGVQVQRYETGGD